MIINVELNQLLHEFKPEFGNQEHLNITRRIDELGKLHFKLDMKREYTKKARGQDKLQSLIAESEKTIVGFLRRAVDKPVDKVDNSENE